MRLFRLLLLAALGVLVWRTVQRTRLRAPQLPVDLQRRDALRVLGLTANAQPSAIRQAYQRLAQQYHPDRMMGLAPELQILAEQRMKELNVAYAVLQRGRR